MLTPAFVFVLGVAVYPIFRILWLSFFTQNLATELQPQFAGIHNYVRALNDGHFWRTIGITCFFTAATVSIELILGLALALLVPRIDGTSKAAL